MKRILKCHIKQQQFRRSIDLCIQMFLLFQTHLFQTGARAHIIRKSAKKTFNLSLLEQMQKQKEEIWDTT